MTVEDADMALPFQSTFSVRRATLPSFELSPMRNEFQSTFSVRRATNHTSPKARTSNISIHVLREESDLNCDRG